MTLNNLRDATIENRSVTHRMQLTDTLGHLLFQYLSAVLLSILTLYITTGLWKIDIHFPFAYSGDSVQAGVWFKTVIETGWNVMNPYLGAPLHYDLSSFPISEGFNYLLIKIIAFFSSDYALVMNIFFILTFPSSALTAFFVMKRIGLNYPFALVASVLFAMAPYHFFRFENHIFLSSYWAIPLISWLALLIAKNKIFMREGNFRFHLNKNEIFYCLLCFLIGSSGIYYAFFGVFFIFIGGMINSLQHKKAKFIWPALMLISIIICSGILNLAPSIISRIENGKNPEVANRSPIESEIYALNITGLLMPSTEEAINIFPALASKYRHSTTLRTGEFSRLGLLGSIGFVFLIFLLFFHRNSLSINNKIKILSQLNIAGILLGTVGGFGSFIAYTISPMIRCYGRISIFIMFFSLIAFFYLIQIVIKKFAHINNRYFIGFLSGILLTIGLLSQYDAFHSVQRYTNGVKTEFYNDEKFIKIIENTLPKNSMIFQMPYFPFPEFPRINQMVEYDSLKGYLHSHHLRWSSGAMKGESSDLWQRKISALPMPLLVNSLVYMGFSGIYIDRHGYADNGKNIESQLTRLLKSSPIYSEDKHLVFYDLTDYIGKLKESQSTPIWLENVARAKQELGR